MKLLKLSEGRNEVKKTGSHAYAFRLKNEKKVDNSNRKSEKILGLEG